MNKEKLVHELRNNEHLLPRDILNQKRDVKVLVLSLKAILDEYRDELVQEELFRDNFINTINYVYVSEFNGAQLSAETSVPQKTKHGELFTKKSIDAVFSLPVHA